MLVGIVGLSIGRLNAILDTMSIPSVVLRAIVDINPIDAVMRAYLVDKEFDNKDGFYITPTAINEYDRLSEEERGAFNSLMDYSFLDYIIYVTDGDTARSYDEFENKFEASSLRTILEGLYDECV